MIKPTEELPTTIKQKLAEKRRADKRWQLTRAPQDKQHYSKIAKELKHLLQTLKNEGIQTYLQELTPTKTQTTRYGKPPAKLSNLSIKYCQYA